MQIVTDSAADISQEQLDRLKVEVHRIPLMLTLDGKDYLSGVDIGVDEFYQLLENSDGMPTTSQPSPADVVKVYHDVVEKTGDKEIVSVHISAGLSGTPNAVRLAIEEVAKEGITVHLIDTRTLSAPQGWQVEAAARAIDAGWSIEQIKDLLGKIGRATNCVYTLPDLKYLIHGGRIGHMKGLIASTLGIKPLIGVSQETAKYEQRGQVRTFKRAVPALADSIAKMIPAGSKLRVQPLHAHNMEGMQNMMEAIEKKFDVEFMPHMPIAPILGAHTGAGMVGCAFAPADQLPELP